MTDQPRHETVTVWASQEGARSFCLGCDWVGPIRTDYQSAVADGIKHRDPQPVVHSRPEIRRRK